MEDDLDCFFSLEQYNIFPATFIFRRWLSVSRQYLKLDIVNMNRVRHHCRIGDFPYFDVVQIDDLINPVDIHALSIDSELESKHVHSQNKFTGPAGLTFLQANNGGQ